MCIHLYALPLPEDFLTVLSIGKWDTYKCYFSLNYNLHINEEEPLYSVATF